MSKLANYVLTQNFNAPYVVATGLAHNPSAVKMKKFRKGDIVKGELKHSNNQPAFILVEGTLVLPLGVIKQLVTKDVVSYVDGDNQSVNETKKINQTKDPKTRYVDAAIVGAIVGFVAGHIAEKQGWVQRDELNTYKNKVIGAGIGALLAAYFVYRKKMSKTITIKKLD